MKYFARIGERTYECDIESANGELSVVIGGERYRVDLRHIQRSRSYTLLLDGKSYEFTLEENDDAIECSGAAGQFHVDVQDARTHAARSKTATARAAAGPRAVKAVMPGIVREVTVKVGDSVQPGQALLILEAMKMQNQIRADRAGTVLEVCVSAGETVDKGAKLIEME